MLKATEKHTHPTNSERSEGVRGIVDTETPSMTAQTLVNALDRDLYLCHSDVQLYRPKSVAETAEIKIDTIRTNHSSTESILKMLLHLGYLTEHGTYQRTLVMKYGFVESKYDTDNTSVPKPPKAI